MSTSLKYLKNINFKFNDLKSKKKEKLDEKKRFLFSKLGIPLTNLHHLKILEIGPGNGNTAEAILEYSEPKKYVFVDIYPGAIRSLKKKFRNKNIYKFHSIDFTKFKSKEKFDYVILEGLLPGIEKPENFLRHACRFLKDQGIIIITATSEASFVSDALRRSIKPILEFKGFSKKETREIITSSLSVHLKKLSGQARNIDNWIDDTIYNPMKRIMFNFKNVLKTVGNNCTLYASSPEYSINHTWYKQLSFKKKILKI